MISILQNPGTTICIAGPIAAGKSTFIDRLKLQANDLKLSCHIMPELLCPSLGEQLPRNPQLFDTFIIGHRLQMSLDAPRIAQNHQLVIMERSHLDHLAFLFAFDAVGTISRTHTDWVRQVIKELNPPIPDRFVYLDISAKLAFERMRRRSETRDANFSLEFLTSLIEGYSQVISEFGLKSRLLKLDWTNFGDELSLAQLVSDLHLSSLA